MTDNKLNDLPGNFPSNLINKITGNSIYLNTPIAIYRLPKNSNFTVIAGKDKDTEVEFSDLETIVPGYILAPFNNEQKVPFIKADVILSVSKKGIEQEQIKDNQLFNSLIQKKGFDILFASEITSADSSNQYEEIVSKAIEEIKAQKLKKVVIARSKLVENSSTDFGKIFTDLCKAFPYSFISLVFHPKFGTWVGASPELLISLDKEKKFSTVALAGTQRIEKESPAEAVWRQKEIEEQALVSRYIINCFKTIRLRKFEEEGPKTIRAGNLLHLKTNFWVNLKDVQMEALTSKMLSLLHPTSAVGGMPRAEAMNFIKKNENFDRELFAGFWGPVNVFDEIYLFVNIRTAKVFKNAAILFAGAGITEESVPEKEFLETELKMSTIGNILSSKV